ncbi:MAG: hypothetical protein IT572_04605 [Deltaproteobacteria bacterium]|nr:hypothetical protein [Deltaproteobacteria bacterium]
MSHWTIETFPALPEKNYSDPNDDPAIARDLFPAEPANPAEQCADPRTVEVEEFPAVPELPLAPLEVLRQAHTWLNNFLHPKTGSLGSRLWESRAGDFRIHLDLDKDLPCHVVKDPEENILVQCDKK